MCRIRRKQEKQERAAAALRASSSRRRSQALMLSVPAVRRVVGAADKPAQAAEAGQQAAAADAPLLADMAQPDSTSPAGRPETAGQSGAVAAAAPALPVLGPVKGTKRLCRHRDADAAAPLAAVVSMPASLADSTQQDPPSQRHQSPLHDRLAGDAAPSAMPRAESPLPDWLCNDMPGKVPGHSAKASVSPLWLMDSQEAPAVPACRSDLVQQTSTRQPKAVLGWSANLADPPTSLVGGSAERAGQKPRPAAAAAAEHIGCRADAAFGAWRSRSGFMQPPQPPSAALQQNQQCPTSQDTYQDTFR